MERGAIEELFKAEKPSSLLMGYYNNPKFSNNNTIGMKEQMEYIQDIIKVNAFNLMYFYIQIYADSVETDDEEGKEGKRTLPLPEQ